MVKPSSFSISAIDKSIIKFFSTHKTYTAFLLVLISAILLYGMFSSPKATQETHTVNLGAIKQYVKVSGQISASKDANLSFQTSGAVSFVGVKPGDKVTQGRVLATLEGGDSQASLLQAEANLANQQAILDQLKQGARKEEVAIKEQILENAKESLDQSYKALPDTIQNVDAITADVIKNKFSSLFVFSNSRYLLSFSSCDQRLQSEIETKRTNLENILASFQKKSSVITAISSTETVDSTFQAAYEASIMTNDLVNAISNLLLSSCSTANPSLEGYRATLSSAKASMTALFSDITVKRSALITAKNAFNQASRDLDLTKAGTDPYKLKSQMALVSQAEAQVATAKSGVRKTMIVAPFSGVISSSDLSLGETVTAGKTVISMLAVESYEIEAKVPEADIIKVKVGSPVDVTLDAYGQSVIFPATVIRINPTAATEGGVPVYTTIIAFTGKDDRIKQGMTANVQIVTETKTSTLTVPARFVRVVSQSKGEVIVFTDGKEVVREITLGIRGAEGLLEVLGGLFVGDVIVPLSSASKQQVEKAK